MKLTALVLFFSLSVAFVHAEINASCHSNEDCDPDNREECKMPGPTESSTQYSHPVTDSVEGRGTPTESSSEATEPSEGPTEATTEPTAEPTTTPSAYTCQCKPGYHVSTANETSCAKDITDEDNYKCYKAIDCAEIDYPTPDYEEDFEANPVCDMDQSECRCGEKTSDDFWIIAMYGSQAKCFHRAVEDDDKLMCSYTQECEYLSKDNNGEAVCTKEKQCECMTKGYELYQHDAWSCEVALGGSCDEDEDCSKIENAACTFKDEVNNGTCQCKPEYPNKDTHFRCSSAASLSSFVSLLPILIFAKLSLLV